MPALNSTEVHSDTLTINHVERASTKSSKFNLTVPDSSVAGLIGEEVQRLETLKDTTAKVKPRSMTWLPTGDFYVGCEGGEIFKVR